MLGVERSVVPLLGREHFGLASHTAVLSFIAAFGLAKAPLNLMAGRLADRIGRRPILLVGWTLALPVPAIITAAPSWRWVIGANVLLGLQQGLCWSTSIFMKVDLAGNDRRGLAIGINECAGYAGTALAAYGTGALAAAHSPEVAPFLLGEVFAIGGLVMAALGVAETASLTAPKGPGALPTTRGSFFAALCFAGLVTKTTDAAAWGLLPVWFRFHGASLGAVAMLTAAYPAVWAAFQPASGACSDTTWGRRTPIIAGLGLQSLGLLVVASSRSFSGWLPGVALLGLGTALVYPVLLAAAGDTAPPARRASAIGLYRFWRDTGFVAGALLAGMIADRFGVPASLRLLALLMMIASTVLVVGSKHRASNPSAADEFRAPAASPEPRNTHPVPGSQSGDGRHLVPPRDNRGKSRGEML
jgi:MFS family permease